MFHMCGGADSGAPTRLSGVHRNNFLVCRLKVVTDWHSRRPSPGIEFQMDGAATVKARRATFWARHHY